MKTFLKKLAFLLPLPLFVMYVNYKQDPANLFKGGKYEAELSGMLLQGKSVTNLLNYDERNFQQLYVKKLNKCPEILVLGSSKTLMLEQEMFGSTSFYNGSLSAGCMEDMLAMYELFDKKACAPKKVIIGLDPWLLNESNGMERWKKFGSQYAALLGKLKLDKKYPVGNFANEDYKNYAELLSFSYFQQSVVDWLRGVDTRLKPSQSATNVMATKHPDGSYMYESSYRDRSPDQVKRNAESEIAAKPIKGFHDFTALSSKYKEIFESFIDYLQSKNVEVILFMAPYHPIVYDFFKKDSFYHIVFTADDYFRKLATTKKIKIHGSMDPSIYKLSNTDFYDGVHCDKETIVRLMKEL